MRAVHIPARTLQPGDILNRDGEQVLEVLPGPGKSVRIYTTRTTRTNTEWNEHIEHMDSPVVVYRP